MRSDRDRLQDILQAITKIETQVLTARQAANKRRSKGKRQKSKNQKAKISAPGRGPDWGGIFTVWPQSKQSSMTQFLGGAGNWPPRGIFAAREEMGL